MTPEGEVKNKIKKILDAHSEYITYLMYVPTGYGGVGTEDFTLCAYGIFMAVEAKATEKSKLSEMQKERRLKVLNAGGIHLIIHKDNLDVLSMFLDKIRLKRKTIVDNYRLNI